MTHTMTVTRPDPPGAAPGPGHRHPQRRPLAVTRAALEQAASQFQAAGDPERLLLLATLAEGEACVTELAAESGTGMSTVSQRLRVLRDAGLVRRRREGKHLYYRLADDHVTDLVVSALEHAVEPR